MEFAEELAEVGYDAYAKAANWKNYQGLPMPQWKDLPENIRQYWIAATRAILQNA